MERAPGWTEVATQWTFDVPFVLLSVVLLGVYGRAFLKARRSTSPHPMRRLVSFSAGVLIALFAVVSPIGEYGKQLLWVDFTGFLLLTMIAPPLIALGAPLTLGFRASGPAGRRRLRGFVRSGGVSLVTFPAVTWLLFAGVTYLWQFTDWTDLAARNLWVRELQRGSLLLVGVLFWLPAVSPDPVRWRLPYPFRALYVFVEMTHKGLFGGMFLSMQTAMHSEFASRAPAWAPDAMTDQRIAILVLWLGGNLIFLVALVGIVVRWVQYEQRNQRRTDWRLRLQNDAAAKRRAALKQVFTR